MIRREFLRLLAALPFAGTLIHKAESPGLSDERIKDFLRMGSPSLVLLGTHSEDTNAPMSEWHFIGRICWIETQSFPFRKGYYKNPGIEQCRGYKHLMWR